MMQENRQILAIIRDGQGLREGRSADGEKVKQSLPYCEICGDVAAVKG